MGFFDQDRHDGVCEIRWHGRGGQGAITSAQYMAHAAYLAGFKGVTSAPSFGAERRGAPVTASTRLSMEPLRTFSQVEHPDLVVVLDESLLEVGGATVGLKEGGWLIVNSLRDPETIAPGGHFSVATADASGAAEDAGLVVAGTLMVNTAMLGAVAQATGLMSLEEVRTALHDKFPAATAERNYAAAVFTHHRTRVAACVPQGV